LGDVEGSSVDEVVAMGDVVGVWTAETLGWKWEMETLGFSGAVMRGLCRMSVMYSVVDEEGQKGVQGCSWLGE
jgi:hypothetical protein